MDTHTQNARERLNKIEADMENVSIILDAHTKAIDEHQTRILGESSKASADVMQERDHRLKLAKEQRIYVDEQDLKTALRLNSFQEMGFWARLNWLFTGRCK